MKFQMAKNSLFAVLLRSQWWISFAIAAVIVAFVKMILPAVPVGYAIAAALPFIGIGAIAAWRQLRAPSAGRIVRTLEAVQAMSWGDFSGALEDAFRRDGYSVSRLNGGGAADFEMSKAGRTALVACKRWKVARTGVEPLRELHAAKETREANDCIYVAAGEITEGARKFAAQNRIRLVDGAELAKLLPRAARGVRTA
jgi:restriction system protein